MDGDRTVGDLYKAMVIFGSDLDAAVDAYMTDPTTDRFAISEGHTADLAATVAASPVAIIMLSNPATKSAPKRSVVRTAILLSRLVKT